MKKTILIFLLMVFVSLFAVHGWSQINNDYEYLHPQPQGGYLRWVKMWDANNWYAVGYATTFMKTSDGGNTWTVLNNIYTDNSGGYDLLYSAYFIDMNTGWAGGNSGKIIKTTDGGATWDTSGFAVSSSATWYGLYFLDANTGFASGTSSGRIAKTTDGGATWNQVGTPPSASYYNIWAADTNNIIATSTSGRIRKTTDGGSSWTTVTTGGSATLYGLAFINNDTGFVSGSGSTIRMTTDFGDSWTDLETGFFASSTFYDVDVNGPNVYLTGNSFDIYYAPIGTTSWDTLQILEPSQPWTGTFYSSDFLGDTITSVGAYGMVNTRYSPSNRVAHTDWDKAGSLYDIWGDSASGRIIAVGAPGSSGSVFDQVMYSTNSGVDWNIANFSATADEDLNSICMINTLTGYVAGDEGGVHKTTDGGANWTELTATGNTTELEKVIFLDVNTGYVFGDDGNDSKTTDGGTTWSPYVSGHGSSDIYGAYFLDANTGWTVGQSGKIYMTTDGGATTSSQSANVGTSTIYDINMFDSNTGWLSSTSGKVRKTTDGGTNWDTVDVPFSATCYSVYFYDENNGIVTSTTGRVYRTTDGGDSWKSENVGYSTVYQSHMVGSEFAYICGSIAGIWKYQEIISGTELTFTNTVPENYFLRQNYPNPFNPTTTIKFGLPISGDVQLRIYDMAGREVAELINDRMNAGLVTYNFNGSNFSSGVYFYSLVVDNELISTKKMVLVK